MSKRTRTRGEHPHSAGTESANSGAAVRSGKPLMLRWGLPVRTGWRRARAVLNGPRARAQHVFGTVTPAGWFVFTIIVLGAGVGASAGWVEGWALAVSGMVLLLIALPFLWGARNYRTDLELPVSHTVVGNRVTLLVSVTNTGGRQLLPARAEVPIGTGLREVRVPGVRPHERVDVPLSIETVQRGVLTVGPVTLARRDPLGLLRRELTWRETYELSVHPKTVALPTAAAGHQRDLDGIASTTLTDADLAFHAVREYTVGDAMRHVHWKATAKRGTLMVRQYEETQRARTAVIFDAHPNAYGSDEAFELGVSAAASLSVQAVREGNANFVGVSDASSGKRSRLRGLAGLPTQTPQQLLNAWARVLPEPTGAPVDQLVSKIAHSDLEPSAVLVVTGAQPNLTRLRRAAAALPGGVDLLCVRSDPLADPTVHRFAGLTVVTMGALPDLQRWFVRGLS